jgi:uncharacterized protein
MRANWPRLVVAFLASGLISGCYTVPIEPGWFTPPAEKLVLLTPANVGLKYQRIEVAAPAGYTIHGWYIPAEGAPATVLINHGAIFNRSAYLPHCVLLHKAGYNVVVYDYRGFGESPGPASLGTLIPDADAVLAYLQDRPDISTGRIVLFGISLGTVPTLALAAQAPAGVVGVVLDGSFERDSVPSSSYPAIGVLAYAVVIAELYIQYADLDSTQYIGQVTLPKLFIQSPQDTTTPIVGAQRLFELAPEPKEFCEVFGGHTLSSVLDPGYGECLATFLDSVALDGAADGK